MIDIETLSRLKAMRLSGMAEYFENMAEQTATNGTPLGPEMVKMAVDWEYERRRNSKLSRLRKHAGLAQHGGPPRAPRLIPQRNNGSPPSGTVAPATEISRNVHNAMRHRVHDVTRSWVHEVLRQDTRSDETRRPRSAETSCPR